MASDYWSRLHLRGSRLHTEIALKCRHSTAVFFGWDKALGPFMAKGSYEANGRISSPSHPWDSRAHLGGTPMRIGLSASKASNPAGLTKRFRVNSDATLRDLAYLAHVTVPEFGWMTDLRGRRISREQWLLRHAKFEAAAKAAPSDPGLSSQGSSKV